MKENTKFSLCYAWKCHENEPSRAITSKIVQKIATIAMISTSEEETSLIKKYSKELIEVLEIFINQIELATSRELGFGATSMEDIEK